MNRNYPFRSEAPMLNDMLKIGVTFNKTRLLLLRQLTKWGV